MEADAAFVGRIAPGDMVRREEAVQECHGEEGQPAPEDADAEVFRVEGQAEEVEAPDSRYSVRGRGTESDVRGSAEGVPGSLILGVQPKRSAESLRTRMCPIPLGTPQGATGGKVGIQFPALVVGGDQFGEARRTPPGLGGGSGARHPTDDGDAEVLTLGSGRGYEARDYKASKGPGALISYSEGRSDEGGAQGNEGIDVCEESLCYGLKGEGGEEMASRVPASVAYSR